MLVVPKTLTLYHARAMAFTAVFRLGRWAREAWSYAP